MVPIYGAIFQCNNIIEMRTIVHHWSMVIKTIGSGSIKNMVNVIKSPPSHKITLQKPGNIKSLPLTFCHFAQIPKFPHKILNQP